MLIYQDKAISMRNLMSICSNAHPSILRRVRCQSRLTIYVGEPLFFLQKRVLLFRVVFGPEFHVSCRGYTVVCCIVTVACQLSIASNHRGVKFSGLD